MTKPIIDFTGRKVILAENHLSKKVRLLLEFGAMKPADVTMDEIKKSSCQHALNVSNKHGLSIVLAYKNKEHLLIFGL